MPGCAIWNFPKYNTNQFTTKVGIVVIDSVPSPLDRAAVTEIADHVSLNGRAYECLSLKGQAVCHWTVAGSITPPERPAAKPQKGKENGK